MSRKSETAALVFKVESGGEPFGTMILEGGLATAWTATASRRAITAIAVSWLVSQNPRPDEPISFTFVQGLLDGDGSTVGASPPDPSRG